MEKYTSNQSMSFGKRLENFWFYHKWHVLAGLLIVCIFAIGVHSCVNKDSIDMYVLYMVNGAYSDADNDELAKKLENYAEDLDGDGETRVQIITVSFSEVLDRTDRAQEATLTRMVGQVASGPALFYIFDDENYQALKDAKVEIFDDLSMIKAESSPYLDGDRFNAGNAGFFEGIPGFENSEKPLYFGLRNSENIPDNDSRYPQINQCAQTLTKIIQAYN